MITVKVTGCVKRMGDYRLPVAASLSDAISKATGFRDDHDFKLTGWISIRSARKHDGKYYCRRKIHMKKTSLAGVFLKDRDLIVVQYQIKKLEPDHSSKPFHASRSRAG
jgi:hypothetical protein